MKTKINPLMWSKNSVPLALKIEGSEILAIYVKRKNMFIVYYHVNKLFAIDLKDVHAKNPNSK